MGRPTGSEAVYWYAELGTRHCSLGIQYDGEWQVNSYHWMRDDVNDSIPSAPEMDSRL
jgi:hypothetical protein